MNPQDRNKTIIKYVLLVLLIVLVFFFAYQAHKYTGLYNAEKNNNTDMGLKICPKTICPANKEETPEPTVSTPAPTTTTRPRTTTPTPTPTITDESIYMPPAPPSD